MADTHGVAIIGTGWVAGEYLKAFRDHPGTEVVGVYNRTREKASALLEDLDVEAQVYRDVDELFDDEKVGVVVSCTPPDVRPEHLIRAAETGRHVVIEKPVALDAQNVQAVRKAIDDAGVKSVTSFVLRWNPQLETVRKLVDDGLLGELVYAEGDYWHPIKKEYPPYEWMMTKEIGGSAFIGAGCHAADAVRWLAGEVVEVAAFSAGPKRNPDYQYDPNVVATLRFANGAVGKLSTVLDAETPYIFNTRIFGTEGTAQNNRVYSKKRYPGSLDYWEFPTIAPDSGDVSHHPFVPEVAHFIECIDTDVESHASIHDTHRSMALCFAIDESAANGGEPVDVNLD